MSASREARTPSAQRIAEILLASSLGASESFFRSGRMTAVADDGQWIVVPIPIERGRAARVVSFLTLRLRIRKAMRTLKNEGADSLRAYAVVPDLDDPTLVYELASPASEYARANLAWATASRLGWLRRGIERMAGVDASAGMVLLAGRVDAGR